MRFYTAVSLHWIGKCTKLSYTTSRVVAVAHESGWPLIGPLERSRRNFLSGDFYLEPVYFVTALVPSLTACLASSPGSRRRTAVWISRLVMVERLL